MKPLTDQMFDRAEDARDQVRALESELDAERLRCQELARMLDRVRTDYRAVAQALGSVSDTEAGTYEPAPLGVVLARITELHAAAIRETDRAFAEMRAAEVARDEALALAAEHEDACDDAVRRNRIALDNKIHWMAGMAVVHFFDLARMQALEECVRDLVRKACRAPVVPERDAATGVMSPLREVVEVGQSTTLRPGDSLDLRTGEVTRDPARKGGSVDLSMIIGDPPAAPKPEATREWAVGDACEVQIRGAWHPATARISTEIGVWVDLHVTDERVWFPWRNIRRPIPETALEPTDGGGRREDASLACPLHGFVHVDATCDGPPEPMTWADLGTCVAHIEDAEAFVCEKMRAEDESHARIADLERRLREAKDNFAHACGAWFERDAAIARAEAAEATVERARTHLEHCNSAAIAWRGLRDLRAILDGGKS
jgi:hypothetical protein